MKTILELNEYNPRYGEITIGEEVFSFDTYAIFSSLMDDTKPLSPVKITEKLKEQHVAWVIIDLLGRSSPIVVAEFRRNGEKYIEASVLSNPELQIFNEQDKPDLSKIAKYIADLNLAELSDWTVVGAVE